VQRAARKVAQENVGLRSLLARKGVSQVEIDDYLNSFREAAVSNSVATDSTVVQTSCRPGACGPSSKPEPVASQPRCQIQLPKLQPLQQPSLPQLAARPTVPPIARESRSPEVPHDPRIEINVPSPPVSADDNFVEKRQINDSSQRMPVPTEPHCPSTADCFCPPPIPKSYRPPSPGLEISCEAAATIIVEMRGDGDIESARASLGCFGREECNVKNSTVLQIMDER
jgi:hypothetical protein